MQNVDQVQVTSATPVIANAECDVLHGHCVKSGGGMSYGSYEEFEKAIDTLYRDISLRKRMGKAGRNYVVNNYSPDIIATRYIFTINSLISDRQRQQEISVNCPPSTH
jgi:glycosyltransferase involved in cell wall biosynthesis